MSLGWDDYVCFYGYISVIMGGNLVVLSPSHFLFLSRSFFYNFACVI